MNHNDKFKFSSEKSNVKLETIKLIVKDHTNHNGEYKPNDKKSVIELEHSSIPLHDNNNDDVFEKLD